MLIYYFLDNNHSHTLNIWEKQSEKNIIDENENEIKKKISLSLY